MKTNKIEEIIESEKPIVFACAGCSFAAKLSWDLAKELDRQQLAEMSCLAGVGARKKYFLNKLINRKIWVIDGCPIECGKGIFCQINTPINRHIKLFELGFQKNQEIEVDMENLIIKIYELETS